MNTGEGRVSIAKTQQDYGVLKGSGDFQRKFGYIGTWLSISKLFGRTYLIRVSVKLNRVGSMSNSINRLNLVNLNVTANRNGLVLTL